MMNTLPASHPLSASIDPLVLTDPAEAARRSFAAHGDRDRYMAQIAPPGLSAEWEAIAKAEAETQRLERATDILWHECAMLMRVTAWLGVALLVLWAACRIWITFPGAHGLLFAWLGIVLGFAGGAWWGRRGQGRPGA